MAGRDPTKTIPRATRSRFKPPDDEDNGEDSNSISNRKSSSIQKTRRSSRDHHGGPLRIINVNLKTLLSFGVLAFLIATFIIFNLMRPTVEEAQKLRVITPFPAPKLMDLPQFQGEHKESLYWGTYRPHVYLGVRAREKELAAVKINANEVDIIADQLELDEKVAKQTLREHKGDAVAAIRHLLR